MDYYAVIKRNSLLIHETTWLGFKESLLSEQVYVKMSLLQNGLEITITGIDRFMVARAQ